MCTLWKGVRWKALEEGELLLSCQMLQEDLAKEIRSPKSSQWEAQKHTSSDEGKHWSDTEMGKELTFIRTRLGQSPNKRRDREKWGIWEETGTEWERTGRGKGGDQDQVQKLFWNGVDNKEFKEGPSWGMRGLQEIVKDTSTPRAYPCSSKACICTHDPSHPSSKYQ